MNATHGTKQVRRCSYPKRAARLHSSGTQLVLRKRALHTHIRDARAKTSYIYAERVHLCRIYNRHVCLRTSRSSLDKPLPSYSLPLQGDSCTRYVIARAHEWQFASGNECSRRRAVGAIESLYIARITYIAYKRAPSKQQHACMCIRTHARPGDMRV